MFQDKNKIRAEQLAKATSQPSNSSAEQPVKKQLKSGEIAEYVHGSEAKLCAGYHETRRLAF